VRVALQVQVKEAESESKAAQQAAERVDDAAVPTLASLRGAVQELQDSLAAFEARSQQQAAEQQAHAGAQPGEHCAAIVVLWRCVPQYAVQCSPVQAATKL
jgi:SLT domain-containing protein